MPTLYEAAPKSKKDTRVSTPIVTHPHNILTDMTPLTAYAEHPQHVRFETQEKEEEVILFLRQHFVVNIPWIIMTGILVISPMFLFPFVLRSLPFALAIPGNYFFIGTLLWYLVTFGFVLANFVHWFFNIYVVTNERIVDIDFIHLLYKEFSQTELDKIQDTTYSTGGIVATVFDYGNVRVETAGEVPNLEFYAVPKPGRVVEAIRQATEKMKKSKRI